MKGKYSFLLLIFIFLYSFQSNAQWTASTGLDGMEVREIGVYDSIIYLCGGYDGLYFKRIDDESWMRNNPPVRIDKITSTESVLFGIDASEGLKRSFDQGYNWEVIAADVYYISHISAIRDNVIISGNDSTYLSNDNGESWGCISSTLPLRKYNYSLVFDTILFVGDHNTDSIFRSDDLGQTWDTVTTVGIPDYYGKEIFCIVEFNDSLWAATKKGVYVFAGNEAGWLSRNNGITIQRITDLLVHNDTLYCSTKNGIFYLNQGIWYQDNEGLEVRDVKCLVLYNGIEFCGTSCGPFQRQEEETWQGIYHGLNHLDIAFIANNGQDVWVCTVKGLLKSTDRGKGFEFLPHEEFSDCRQLFITDSLFYLSSTSGLFVSRDSGTSWIKISGDLTVYGEMAVGANYIFLKSLGIYRADHVNYNWELLPNWLAEKNVWELAAMDTMVLASVYGSSTYLSTDNGDTFVYSISESAEIISRGNQFYAISPYNHLKISDDGVNWSDYPFPDNEWYAYNIAVNQEAIVVGGSLLGFSLYDLMVGISYDGGNTWSEVSYGLPLPSWPIIHHIDIFDNRLFASPNNNGLWYRDDLLVGEQELNSGASGKVLLFPNPVKSLLTIDVSNSFREPVQLKISDVNGRIVKQWKLAALKSSFELTDLKPGIYFLQFVGEGRMITQKIVKQ